MEVLYRLSYLGNLSHVRPILPDFQHYFNVYCLHRWKRVELQGKFNLNLTKTGERYEYHGPA